MGRNPSVLASSLSCDHLSVCQHIHSDNLSFGSSL